MKLLLNYLRQRPEFYTGLKKFYGNTIGLWQLKTLYLKKVGLWNGQKRVKLVGDEESNKIIAKKLISKESFMACRYGSTEFRNLVRNDELGLLCQYSGFFPNNPKLLKKFQEVYFESSKKIDYLFVWNYLNHFNDKRKLLKNFSNVNYFFNIGVARHTQAWVKCLGGKRVLVIHPFKKTIEIQYKKMNKLKILPKLKKIEVIKAVQTLAGTRDPRFETWFEALDYMKKEIDKRDFDVALIGCGAYGLPLAAYVKSIGKQAIHVGGGLQLFFGIRGKRWDTLFKVKTNKHWIYPLKEDSLKEGKKIENGCYW